MSSAPMISDTEIPHRGFATMKDSPMVCGAYPDHKVSFPNAIMNAVKNNTRQSRI